MGWLRGSRKTERVEVESGFLDRELFQEEVPEGPGIVIDGWRWDFWRLAVPTILLGTIVVIAIRSGEAIFSNHWAYPALLAVVAIFALILFWRARPRKARRRSGARSALTPPATAATQTDARAGQ